MAKAQYWQRGETIDYVNTGSDTIEANEVVVFGSHVGIAATDIEPGEVGSLAVSLVWELTKDSAAITLGADVYVDTDGEASATQGTGMVLAGYAIEAAAADAETVKVKLLG